MIPKVYRKNKAYLFIMLLTGAVSFGLQGGRILFSNYAVHRIGMGGLWVGLTESVREIPGLVCFFAVYLLFVFTEDIAMAHFSVLLGIGIFLTGLFPSKFGLLFCTLIMSIGFHFFETTRQSIVLQGFELKESAVVFGSIRSITALGNVVVGGIIFLAAHFLSMETTYIMIGIVVIILSISSYKIKFPRERLHFQHKKIIINKRYYLFYMLNFLAGSRRQIFVVFSIFLLVKHYGMSLKAVAILFIISNILNCFMAEKLSRKIDDMGEKKILIIESIIAFSIFMSYAFINCRWFVASLYVVDSVVFSFLIAVKTYLQKIADKKDIASATAVGFTFNHFAAVAFPLIGGILWVYSPRIPFIIGAILSIISLLCAGLINLPTLKFHKIKTLIENKL